ncbi:hypothetical protein TeGR_g12623 [Tetraparma gracilis]|uniref:Uncharacterized protein n=1 Tax=Tetraparma gracilis TaxID=2962635 RepID=A0ABQ6MZC5_9STRA|nr:hypothetical protein TeGR_g12623 [Tetraparma gracilis]
MYPDSFFESPSRSVHHRCVPKTPLPSALVSPGTPAATAAQALRLVMKLFGTNNMDGNLQARSLVYCQPENRMHLADHDVARALEFIAGEIMHDTTVPCMEEEPPSLPFDPLATPKWDFLFPSSDGDLQLDETAVMFAFFTAEPDLRLDVLSVSSLMSSQGRALLVRAAESFVAREMKDTDGPGGVLARSEKGAWEGDEAEWEQDEVEEEEWEEDASSDSSSVATEDAFDYNEWDKLDAEESDEDDGPLEMPEGGWETIANEHYRWTQKNVFDSNARREEQERLENELGLLEEATSRSDARGVKREREE